jgi:hypothetical protein
VPDLPVTLSSPELAARLAAAVDREEKVAAAIAELGAVVERDVVLVDGEGGMRAAQLAARGARVRAVTISELASLAEASADVVVAAWTGFAAGSASFDDELAAARRVARPGARLLVVQDYGRDDVRDLVGAPAGMSDRARDRDDWFLRREFKIRVLHCWWTFESLDEARTFLGDAFGEAGTSVGELLRRPRLSHKIAIYHRSL